jgi:iron complex transport system substrate-binding protein
MNSHEGAKPRADIERIASIVIDTAFSIHCELGPGLLEHVYSAVLAQELESRGLRVERERVVPIVYRGVIVSEGFRLDLLVEERLIVELKSVECIHAVHLKQLLTYLRMMGLPLGLLINFGAPLLKEGLRRVVNRHDDFSSSVLRIHNQLPPD